MKYTIMGFLQSKLKELGLDVTDALVLRYFVDFKDSRTMKSERIGDKTYYWVQYEGVLRELPILNIKKCTVQSRFFKLRDAGVLTHYVKKEGGTYSFFGIGERYAELIGTMEKQKAESQIKNEVKLDENNDSKLDENNKSKPGDNNGSKPGENNQCKTKEKEDLPPLDGESPSSKEESEESYIQEGIDIKGCPMDLNKGGCKLKFITNNPSTKDPSINTSIVSVEEMVSEVIDYLNGATGKRFRKNTKVTVKLIKGRLKEGFTLEDFKTVIDNMTAQWKGTRFQQYLAPSTLFGPKFETYLQVESFGSAEAGSDKYNASKCHGAMRGTMGGKSGIRGDRVPKRGNVGRSISYGEEGRKEQVCKEGDSSKVQEDTLGQAIQELKLILKEDM